MMNIAIIGAGIAGLTVANLLKDKANITMFEKARGVSGRTSTRRAEPYFFDHGAQFFTARTKAFQSFIAPLIEAGVIELWNARFVEFNENRIVNQRVWNEEEPHYVGSPAMNSIAKHLAQGLDISVGTRIQTLTKQDHKWLLEDDKGNHVGEYDWVVSTVPAEQAVDLVPNSLPYHNNISSYNMKACFSLMLGFEKPLPLTFDAALVKGTDISWISVINSKPKRSDAFGLLVHSTNNWADQHIDDDRQEVLDYLCKQTSDVIGHDVEHAEHKVVHGWRYANISKQEGDQFIFDQDQQIGVCGDWFIKGRVESAFTSGYGLAHKMADVIK
ncbi:MAG: FAD-dependent oxidoreductase [Rickettsiales bacterium]|nr:FAD-dependent oxidoreductase [Rickettsiales bacterium]